jgi:catechol 2,3-dioxygenase-like lactoylglutathione lyase family enzyme
MRFHVEIRLTDMTYLRLSTVAIPVTDQDRSKGLLEDLGFEVRMDTELSAGFRWIELNPPGAVTSIALVAASDELPTGMDTGIRLITSDARAARDELIDRGMTVGDLLDWEGVPLMFSFADFDGNRIYAMEES